MIDLSMLPQGAITAILQVIMIDLVLAGDNAVVIGLAAAGLPPAQRNRAILVGIIAATVLRLAFAAIALELLAIVGLLLAGGILLLWVCWKMWRELRGPGAEDTEAALLKRDAHVPRKTFAQAAWQIVIADVSIAQLIHRPPMPLDDHIEGAGPTCQTRGDERRLVQLRHPGVSQRLFP